jgi:hypothetical protein
MEDMWDIKKLLEIQGNMHNKVEVQDNSESRSPCLQINIQDASDLRFG